MSVVIAALLVSCNRDGGADSCELYSMNITYTPGSLHVTQDVLYTPDIADDRLVMRLYANALMPDNNAIDILSCEINRTTVDYEIYGDDRTLLSIAKKVEPRKSYMISLAYDVTLPKGDGRLSESADGTANLSCFYPVVAMYSDGWREDAYETTGDPFFHSVASFYVTVTYPDSLSLSACGNISDSVSADGLTTSEIEAENIRDFAMAIGKFKQSARTVSLGEKSVAIKYSYLSDEAPELALDRAESVVKAFSQAFGDYPYPVFNFAKSKLSGAGGMEYGSFAIISPSESREEFYDAITHEIAHQWWYSAVGNDQLNDAWLDEGLSEFCTCFYYALIGDRKKYSEQMAQLSRSYGEFAALKSALGFDGRMDKHLSAYLTDGEYVAIAYFKGALLFDGLLKTVGETKFRSALKCYYRDNLFKIADKNSLAAAFKQQGYDISRFVDSFITDSALLGSPA